MTDSDPKLSEPTLAGPATAVAEPMPPSPELPPATETETAPAEAAPASGLHWGTGRRKSSVARVRLLPGDGKFLVNQREVADYFPQLRDQMDSVAPLELTGVRRQWDVLVNVNGGGVTGQAGAVRLGLARAIVKAYSQHEVALRDAGFLTRDARRVERKKYGRRKARRRFQFSKR